MFTPDSLLDMAIDFEAQANGLTVSTMVSDAALASDYRGKAYDFRRKSMEATVCAEWMENHGITEAPMIGPFGNIKIEQHVKVRIKAGATVFGFGKEIPHGGKITTRSYTVTATSIDNGYAMSAACGYKGKLEVRNQQVHWAGTGGYWRWTDANNVILEETV